MSKCNWQKLIAVLVVVTFIGMGVAWTAEQAVPQFKEKEGAPGRSWLSC
ncbi:MAG: hypothetical protein NTW95_04575 [Candidatus Aminicenantes bacterium]|nr:hypothetical protein [Candidatus Aminicenantes bacterium]